MKNHPKNIILKIYQSITLPLNPVNAQITLSIICWIVGRAPMQHLDAQIGCMWHHQVEQDTTHIWAQFHSAAKHTNLLSMKFLPWKKQDYQPNFHLLHIACCILLARCSCYIGVVTNFHRYTILCICWDTPSENNGLWQLPKVSSDIKDTGHCW